MSSRFSAALVSLWLWALPAFAQFRTVTVQNANDNPVPATIQNTPSVNVANTPTVSVSGTVPVSGTVGITGTPTVNATITGTPAVSVTNLPTGTAGPSALTGVLTKSLDNPALEPFQQTLSCGNVNGCQTTSTVPAGKELVIEYVQFFTNGPAATPIAYYDLITTAGGNSATYIFAPGPRIIPTFTVIQYQVHIYADPGSTIQFFGSPQTSDGYVQYYATLSGHLVNVP